MPIYKAHSTRAAAALVIKRNLLSVDEILRTAGGLNSNASTLGKFYDKQIMEEGSFSISILNTLEADGAPDLKISRSL